MADPIAEPLRLLDDIVRVGRKAAEVILPFYEGEVEIDDKADGSPVTAADRAADDLIVADLKVLTPDIPILSEESVAAGTCRTSPAGGSGWSIRSTEPKSSSTNAATSR